MIDILALAIPHLLMAIAVWRLVQRPDLDDDPGLRDESGRPPRA